MVPVVPLFSTEYLKMVPVVPLFSTEY